MTMIQSEVSANQQRTPGERKAGEQGEDGGAGTKEAPFQPGGAALAVRAPFFCLPNFQLPV